MLVSDPGRYLRAIRAGRQALIDAHLPSPANTKNRIVDGITYGLEHVTKEDDLAGFLGAWAESSKGSSTWMLATFMDHVLSHEQPNEFTAATRMVELRLAERYAGATPQQLGLMLGFNILATMSQDRTFIYDRVALYRTAAPAIAIIGAHSTDIGFRCFATFLKGFAEAL